MNWHSCSCLTVISPPLKVYNNVWSREVLLDFDRQTNVLFYIFPDTNLLNNFESSAASVLCFSAQLVYTMYSYKKRDQYDRQKIYLNTSCEKSKTVSRRLTLGIGLLG